MSTAYANYMRHWNPLLKLSKTTRAIMWMLAHCVALVVIMAIVRILGTDKFGVPLSSFIIIFWQNIFSFTMLVPICAMDGGWPQTKKIHLHAGRALTGIASGLILFYGMAHVHLNVATAVTFTGPLFSTIFAIIFLKEKFYRHRAIGLFIGFAGILIVLRPGSDAFNPNAALLIITAMLWGGTDVFIKLMIRTESGRAMMFYRALLMLVLTTPLGFYYWQGISQWQMALIIILAIFDMVNFLTVTRAYRLADISTLMPFDFSRLIISSLIAFMIWDETLSLWTFLGSSVIVYGTLFVVYSERKRARFISTETI